MKKSSLLKFLSLWPPYLGAGIRMKSMDPDFNNIIIEMKLRFWNKNYVSTHFGGSLYAMTDPFFMLILLENLGREYIVWDKAANIRFKKPGKGTVKAHFYIPKEKIEEIKATADRDPKVEPKLTVQITDEAGEVVAEVEKLLYVRRKDKEPPPRKAPSTSI